MQDHDNSKNTTNSHRNNYTNIPGLVNYFHSSNIC